MISADSNFLFLILSRVVPSALWVNNPEMSPWLSHMTQHLVSSDFVTKARPEHGQQHNKKDQLQTVARYK